MIGFLKWIWHIVLGTLNGLIMLVLGVVVIVAVFAVAGMIQGDGLPGNIVLTANLRGDMPDSLQQDDGFLGNKPLSVMDAVLAMDRAGRDKRVKGLVLRVGSADLSVPQAEELSAAVARFRKTGRFVVADAQGFLSSGLGDYLLATSANEIWMQPHSPFGPAGAGAGGFFLRGFFDKIQAVPQIVKRSDYKSAADQYMEKDFTPADRLQLTALLQSWYDHATADAADRRKVKPAALIAMLEQSPSFAEDAQKAGLIDKIGFDDDARDAALERAGKGAEAVRLAHYSEVTNQGSSFGDGEHVALIEGAGEIIDGTAPHGMFGNDANVIAGDDFARAIREAAADKKVKAIVLRIDSPGGSVLASDQILDAVKKAQAKGKPVIVSMARLAASGGYYISSSANKIIAEPGTITGSIGVLTGKVSFGKTLNLIGVTANQIGVGKNALADSAITPYTDDQLKALNKQADAIYLDFKEKVAKGRKMPLEKVETIAKGRVWSGADAKAQGLVDGLGDFWVAIDEAKKAAGIDAGGRVVLDRFPRPHSFFDVLFDSFGDTEASLQAAQGMASLARTPLAKAAISAMGNAPKGGVEMRATNLPLDPAE